MTNALSHFNRALLPMALAALATACATAAPATGPYIPPAYAPKVAAAQPAVGADQAADAKFAAFVHDFRTTALAAGIKPETYDRSMAGITRNARVEQANLQQPEFVKPIWEYLDGAVSDKRVAMGAQLFAADTAMLDKLHTRFGVPPEYLVAIWGIESNYGEAMGHLNMFEALATLAYDGPRAEFGRKELIAAFKMEERENLDPKQMTSSWAGAFGQTQFVPSSFLANAVDGDGDGKIDLWHSPADALASTALLLANAGWKDAQPWGFEVTLPAGFDYADADIDTIKTVAEWKKMGVHKASGEFPAGDRTASILIPAGAHGPAFMVFDNFRMVLKYNNAQSYALAVCLLADRDQGRRRGDGRLAAFRNAAHARRTHRLPEQSEKARLRSGRHRRRAGPQGARVYPRLPESARPPRRRLRDAGPSLAPRTRDRGEGHIAATNVAEPFPNGV